MSFLFTAALILATGTLEPAYVLEAPGIEFNYLPEYITPLVEGVVTEEAGAIAGQPNQYGITFSCHYWRTDEVVSDKNLWIQERLSSVISPDLMATINTTTPSWFEGSQLTEIDSRLSLGLMSEIRFTLSPPGGALGRGRAYGIFRNGYSVLIVMYGPADYTPQHELQQIVGTAVLSD